MKKSRKFYALFCAFTVIMLCIPHVQAAPVLNPSFYDVGLGFGPGNVSSSSSSGEEPAQNQQEQQQQSNNAPASSQQTQTGSSSGDASSSGLTPEQIEQQQQQQNQLDNLNQQISIDSQLYSTSQQIQLVNQKIALLQNNIDEANQQIGDLEVEIDSQYEQFKNQIRSSYMSPEYSFLEYLLGSESFADFSVRMETVTRISEHDQSVINQLETQISDLHTLQESLAADKADLEGSTTELESLKNQLNSQSAQAQDYINDIDEMEKAFLADTAALQAKQKAIQAEIDQIYANLESTGEYQGDGTWAWPVPGYSYISSAYGWRFQGTDFHTGMDIAGSGTSIYGARIVASGAGTVVKVQNNGSNGYGLFCIIDHGGGYTTLYAHTSSIVVSVGDVVEKGQTIGYVGNSGWVIPSPSASNPTGGSHLHIEFRINGAHQNPANFLY